MAGIRQIGAVGKRKKVKKQRQDKWLINKLDDMLASKKRNGMKGKFHASVIGNPCDRYLYLAYNGLLPDVPLSARVQRIFDNGSYLEYRMKKYFERMNILIKQEVPCKFDNPIISGRIDFILRHPKLNTVLLELKSIKGSLFDDLDGPQETHGIQAQVYLHLNKLGINTGYVLYENKDNQELKCFRVEKDDDAFAKILDRCYTIMSLRAAPTECSGEFYCDCRKVKL